MTWRVSAVPQEHVDLSWSAVGPILGRATDESHGRHSVMSVHDDLVEGRKQLWIAFEDLDIKGIVVTRVVDYPHRRVLLIQFCAGDGLEEWRGPMLDLLEMYAMDVGCDGLELVGRKGWARMLAQHGWTQEFVVCGKMLSRQEEKVA